MNVSVHNLLTHHSADLRKLSTVLRKKGRNRIADTYTAFDQLLRVAQLFKVPDRGRITGLTEPFGEFQKLIMENADLARLPYPVTCLEWDSAGTMTPGMDYLPPVLMAVAIEGDLFRERMGVFARPPFDTRASVFDKARIFIVPSHALPNKDDPVFAQLGFRPKTMMPNTWHAIGFGPDDCKLVGDWRHEKGAVVSHGFMSWADALACGPTERMLQALEKAAKEDHEECFAVVDFLLAFSCSNVATSKLPSVISKRANERRAADGKPKFYDYHILELTGATEKNEPTGGAHASPRLHLRRGHIRRLHDSGRRVWVNACVVGKPEAGVLIKDYDARPLQQGVAA